MKNKVARIVVCGLLLAVSQGVFAWGQCMPFCDFMCAVPATAEWGAAGAAAYAEEAAAAGELGAAIAASTAAVVELNYGVSLAIAAETKAELAAHTLDMTTSARLTDIETSNYVQRFHELTVLEQTEENKKQILAKEAASASAEVANEGAKDLLTAITAKNSIAAAEPENQKKALKDLDRSRSATFLIQIIKYVEEALTGGSQANQEQSKKYIEIRDHMMMLYTQNMKTTDIKQLKYNINDRIAATRAAAKYSAGIEEAANRYAYLTAAANGGKNKSYYDILSERVNNRLTDPNWFLAIKLANPNGARRELISLKAEENLLLYQIFLSKESQNTYRAMRINND